MADGKTADGKIGNRPTAVFCRIPSAVCRTMLYVDAEDRHRCCWYGRSTDRIPEDLGNHSIVNGQLVYCAHPMYWPVVRYEFDLRNCEDCDVFRPLGSSRGRPERAE